MTREALRRKYIVTSEPPVTAMLREAFDEDDRDGRMTEEAFVDHFLLNDCDLPDVRNAWIVYQKYHNELANYEPVR